MLDWNYITQRLATGARIATPADAAALAGGGITHVLNVCREPDAPGPFEMLHLPLADDGQPKPPEWFLAGVRFALAALARPGPRIYVHCRAGIQRGPSMTYAILRVFGLPPKDAYDLLVRRRPGLTRHGTHIGYRADADRFVKAMGWENEWESYLS